MSRVALISECPLCSSVGQHKVVKTNPKLQQLPIIASPIIYKHTGQTAGFRIRARQCERCNQPFDVIEIPKEGFDSLIKEVDLLKRKLSKLDKITAKIHDLVAETDELFLRKQREEIKASMTKKGKSKG